MISLQAAEPDSPILQLELEEEAHDDDISDSIDADESSNPPLTPELPLREIT